MVKCEKCIGKNNWVAFFCIFKIGQEGKNKMKKRNKELVEKNSNKKMKRMEFPNIMHWIYMYGNIKEQFTMRQVCALWKRTIEDREKLDLSIQYIDTSFLKFVPENRLLKVKHIVLYGHQQLRIKYIVRFLYQYRDQLKSILLKNKHAVVHARTLDQLLYVACKKNMVNIIPSLIEQGANVHMMYEGKRPLYVANMHASSQAMQILLQYGAKVEQSDDRYYSMLQVAAVEGCLRKIKTLVEHHACIDYQTVDGSALGYACEAQHLDAVRYMVQAGAKLEIRNYQGLSPLLIAAVRGNHAIFQFLLSSGANMHATDNRGTGCLAFAVMGGNHDIVQHILRQYGLSSKFMFPPHSLIRNLEQSLQVAGSNKDTSIHNILLKYRTAIFAA